MTSGMTAGLTAQPLRTPSVFGVNGGMTLRGAMRGRNSVNLQVTTGGLAAGNTIPGVYANNAFAAGYDNRVTSRGGIALGVSNVSSVYDGAIAIGNFNTVSGNVSASLGGHSNTVSGGGAASLAGYQNTADGFYGLVHGASAHNRGNSARSYGLNDGAGNAGQLHEMLWLVRTTNGAATALRLCGGSALAVIPNDTTWAFKILLVARRTDANDESAAYEFKGCIDRNANAASTALVGVVTKVVLAKDTPAWDANVTADSTNGALTITVSGESGKTIKWVAYGHIAESNG